MNARRWVVGVLGGCSALIAGLVGAVSLTRIAGDYLGFPPNLEWALTGAVDIAGIAGGVMWTAFRGRVRAIGRPMNLVCTAISGLGVGLDHATHAPPGTRWPAVAFLVGVFIPLLFSWLVHALAVIGDQAVAPARKPARQEPPARSPVPGESRWPAREDLPPEPTRHDPVVELPGITQPEGVRAVARRWLEEHHQPGMAPAALTAAMTERGREISKQEASRCLKWARESGIGPRDREEVPA